MGPSIWQILIVILVALLLFGGGKLPRMMEDFAKGIKAFKKGLRDDVSDGEDGISGKKISRNDKSDDTIIDIEVKKSDER